MSDTNRTSVGIVEESIYGTTPATPLFETLRVTGNRLSFTPQSVISQEIRADRQVADLILVGAEAGGALPYELSFDSQATMFEAIMADVWMNKPTKKNLAADTPISNVDSATSTFTIDADGASFTNDMLVRSLGFTNSANNQVAPVASSTATTVVITPSPALVDEAAVPVGAQLKVVGFKAPAAADVQATTVGGNALTSTLLDFTTLGLSGGQWVKLGGTATANKFATAANNGWCRIAFAGVAANRLDFDIVPTGFATDAAAGVALWVWMGDYIRNGVTKKFYSIETQWQDHSPVTYRYHRGMVGNVLTLTLNSRSIATGNMEWLGQDAVIQDSGRFAGATDLDATSSSVLNTSSNVGAVAENGVVITGGNYITQITMNFNANARGNPAIGSLGFVNVGLGSFTVTGQIRTYFDDKTFAERPILQTLSSIYTYLQDTSAHLQTMFVDLPRLKFGSGDPDIPGPNDDVTVTSDYTAYRHETFGYTAQVQRFFHIEN